jgi:wyosine [tRNA(Phe)-imidazoG37] synthetase (radical SAM superfamily)
MFKVFFYHANDTIGISLTSQIYLGVAALYLKTHLDKEKPHIAEQIEWLRPRQQKFTDDELVEYINNNKPDLVCTSHYIWNHTFLLEQLSRIRDKVPSTVTFAAGGPSIDVNIDDSFFAKYPYIDYAMYGAGEVAFADLVESLITKNKLIKFNTSNIAWFDKQKNKQVVADFKYVPQLPISPYTNNEELFTEMVRHEQSLGISIILPYDLTRGCPYSCTFCDWNSGLTNKTTRRKGTYKDEIDLFQKIKIKNLYLSDANVGQYQEDIDMITYLAQKNLEENAGFAIDGNFSKLRKENNLKIYHIMAQANLMTEYAGFTISVQDIKKEILENIDRPDVGWEVHKSMIKELRDHYPHVQSKVQLIQGLPGQTAQSWRETLAEVCQNDLQLQIFISELLPASPAARDPAYQEKFKFKYSSSERYNGVHYYQGIFPESCVSFTQKDFVEMTALSHLYTAMMVIRYQSVCEFNIENVVNDVIKLDEYKRVKENLYNNWVNHNKFYYTIDLDGTYKDVSACFIYNAATHWSNNSALIKCLAKHVSNRNNFIKQIIKTGNNSLKLDIKSLQGYI